MGYITCFPLQGNEAKLGEPCMQIVDQTGSVSIDNCDIGLGCYDGTCRTICDLSVQGCVVGQTCYAVPDQFIQNNVTWFGLCL